MNKKRLQQVWQQAVKDEIETGVPALFTTAQAVLESTWAIVPIKGTNNIFGIKYHIKKWGYAERLTTEYVNGQARRKVLRFQIYPSIADCVHDHLRLLLSGVQGANAKHNYKECLRLYKDTGDIREYVRCVAASYATDPNYSVKVLNIMEVLKKMGFNDYEVESEKAKNYVVNRGILKPPANEDEAKKYWDKPITKREAAVIIWRIMRFIAKIIT